MQLKQLVPQEFCLRCDICCRFPQAHTVWAPLFTKLEIKHLVENEILPPLLFTNNLKPSQSKSNADSVRINLIEHKDYFICPCLSPATHKCRIYKDRPWECQLYPFLLVKSKNKLYLAKDKKCPYFNSAQQEATENYIEYLRKELLRKESASYLKKNLELFTEYPLDDLELLFEINLS